MFEVKICQGDKVVLETGFELSIMLSQSSIFKDLLWEIRADVPFL